MNERIRNGIATYIGMPGIAAYFTMVCAGIYDPSLKKDETYNRVGTGVVLAVAAGYIAARRKPENATPPNGPAV